MVTDNDTALGRAKTGQAFTASLALPGLQHFALLIRARRPLVSNPPVLVASSPSPGSP